jgi:hypothetical protein
MDQEKISRETLEMIVEEITEAVLERISAETMEIGLGYECTGQGYICKKSYKCMGKDNHSCTGIFECSNVHGWKISNI